MYSEIYRGAMENPVNMFSLLMLLLAAPCVTWAYPLGAPTSTCTSMTPGHPGSQQTSANPYSIVIDGSVTEYKPGMQVRLTISGDQFKGIHLQARSTDSNDNTAYGTFSINNADNVKTISCGGSNNNAVTHSSRAGKQNLPVTWTAPQNDVGELKFVATIVSSYNTWWQGTESLVLRYASKTTKSTAASTAPTASTKESQNKKSTPTESSSNPTSTADPNKAQSSSTAFTLLTILMSILCVVLYSM